MITRQEQRYRHQPEKGIYGDCLRTCVAMLLDRRRDEIPHWLDKGDVDGWDEERDRWMELQGLWFIEIPYTGEGIQADHIARVRLEMNPGVPFMLTGKSPRLTNHCVVIDGNGDIHDPHPDRIPGHPIIAPGEDGLYWASYLTRKL